ncbi:MAG TPA: transposase [Flavobacterium sp.]|nr:transposase [Flavobacterium sp.]
MNIKKSKAGRRPTYDQAFKNTVCLQVLNGKLSVAEAKATYAIKGDGTVYRWIKEFTEHGKHVKLDPMETTNPPSSTGIPGKDEQPALQRENKELQAALEMAKLKITALEVMIDIAESELNINIRKKPGTKQL